MNFPHYEAIEAKAHNEGFTALTTAESLIWLAGTDAWDEVAVEIQYAITDPDEPDKDIRWGDLREWKRSIQPDGCREEYDTELESAYLMSGYRKLRDEYKADPTEGGELHDEVVQAIEQIIYDSDEGYYLPTLLTNYRGWLRDIKIIKDDIDDCYKLMRRMENGKYAFPVDDVDYDSIEAAKAAAAGMGYRATTLSKKPDDKMFSTLWGAAVSTADRDVFVSEWATSSIWEDDPNEKIPAHRLRHLGQIWDAAHTTIKHIRQALGLSQIEFATRFMLSPRTVQNWEYGTTQCPEYVRLLLLQATGLYTR